MKVRSAIAGACAAAAVGLAVSLTISGNAAATQVTGKPAALPATMALPDGFGPESIAIGQGGYAYTGSRFDGSIYRLNLLTGQGHTISPATGTPSWGVKADD